MKSAGLKAGEERAPRDCGFAESGTHTPDGAFALGSEAPREEGGTGADRPIHADGFVTGIHAEIGADAAGTVAPFFQCPIAVRGGAADWGGGDCQTAEWLAHGGDCAGGNTLDVPLGEGEFAGAFAAEPFCESGGIAGNGAAHLGPGAAAVAGARGNGFGFVASGGAVAPGGAFVGLGLEHRGAFEFHGVIDQAAKGFGAACQTGVGERLGDGVQVGIIGSVGQILSVCFWFDHLNRRTGLTRHYHLGRRLNPLSFARLATLAFAPLRGLSLKFTEATLHDQIRALKVGDAVR